MPDESKPLVKITQWQGLASNAEPRHLPPGAAQIQRNFQTTVPGRLTCRKGLQPTAFNAFKASSDVIGLYTYQVHDKDYVVYEATNGTVGTIMAGQGSTLIELVTDYFNDGFRVSFAKSRHNSLIMVNGVDRGKMWDGNDVGTGKAVELGIDAPAAAPGIGVGSAATNGSNGATAGDYVCYYRYVDRSGAPLYSNLSPVTEVTPTANKQFIWIGLSATFQDLNGSGRIRFVELYRSTMGQSTAVYLIQKIGYDGSISNVTTSGDTYIITSNDHGLVLGAQINVDNVSGSGSMPADLSGSDYHVTAVTTNTFTIDTGSATSGNYTSGGEWTLVGYGDSSVSNADHEDDATDATLNAAAVTTPSTVLKILNDDGTLNANRHTVPPYHMSVAVQFQDRMFYAVPVKLDDGKITTNSNTTINLSEAINSTVTNYSALVDRYITIDNSSETESLKITAQSDTTTLTVDKSAKTGTGSQNYVIEAATTERRKLYYSEADLPESVPTVNDTIVQENTGDDDDMTGLMPHGSYLYGLFERHIYRMSFVRQPQLDIQWTLVASRGCFNQACWDRYADLAFLMDQSGPYIVTLISPVPKVIGEEVQDLWRDAKIDFSKSKWFFTKVDPLLQVCRFYYCHTDDNSARPKRAIVYHWPSGAWWEETYPIELGGATTAAVSGQLRTIVGGEDELLLLTHEGTTDIETSEIRGTATGGTSTTVVDSSNPFGSVVVGAPVAIIAGAGKGSISTVTAVAAGTLTVASWSEGTPDNTSTYLVGAIEYQFKSGQFEFPVSESRSQRKLEIIFGTTAGDDTMELRHYLDNSSTAVTHTPGQNKGDGVTIDDDTLHPVVDLKLTRSGLGDQPGFAHIMFSGNRPEDTQAARFIAAEVHGFQGADEIVLSEMSVGGAS